MAQYVYTMRRVSKTVPPKRTIIKNISLNFFPGAKIGVLGLNGAGKSTVLKIMAGPDKDYEGGGTAMPGNCIGHLPPAPAGEPGPTPRAAVEDANVVVTDTWISMGQEHERAKRLADLEPYRLDRDLLQTLQYLHAHQCSGAGRRQLDEITAWN